MKTLAELTNRELLEKFRDEKTPDAVSMAIYEEVFNRFEYYLKWLEVSEIDTAFDTYRHTED